MRKFFLSLAVVACSLLSYAQTNQVVWNNGRMQYAAPIGNIDSITYQKTITESDTLFFILPRSTERVVHDTIFIHDTVYISEDKNDYALKGAFSVSADKQVVFSRGNLQYIQSTKTWGFAENQYDVIGEANVKNNVLADTIDLFGWSANNTTAQWGISTSGTASDYSGDFVDWGKNIGGGNTWRTLTKDEWAYLFQTRTDASSKYGIARINLNTDGSQYVDGVIVLPDIWTSPSGITFKNGIADSYGEQCYADYQTFTLSQWQQLEQAGAVFLPAAGFRSGTNVYLVQSDGSYWSSTAHSTNYAYSVLFYSNKLYPQSINDRYDGWAVRLVQDI